MNRAEGVRGFTKRAHPVGRLHQARSVYNKRQQVLGMERNYCVTLTLYNQQSSTPWTCLELGDWVVAKMASIISTIEPREETASFAEDEENGRGGPIGALVIAIPVSLLLWGLIFFVVFSLVH